MKNIKIILAIFGVLLIFNACDRDKIYQDELYKQVIALVSSDNYNIFEYTHEYEVDETGYIVASCGGTGAVGQDVRISLIEDLSVLDNYNWEMYETNLAKYDVLLPASNYMMDNTQIVIPKGKHSGATSIRFMLDGLSPDTAYYLPLSIERTSAYELNPRKSNMLYRVLIKNKYAEQLTAGYTNYGVVGFQNTSVYTQLEKPVQPLSANSVRTMAGSLPHRADVQVYEDGAIVLEITGNNVQIKPYKEGGILSITQIDCVVEDDVVISGDPLYPNTFRIVNEWDIRYKEFRLHYRYKVGTAAEVTMRERLRLQVFD